MSNRVFSPDNLPFSLASMKKTPRDIARGKAKITSRVSSGESQVEIKDDSRRRLEEAIQMRLLFLGKIQKLQEAADHDPRSQQESKAKILLEIERVKEMLNQTEQSIAALNRYLNTLRIEIKRIGVLTKEEETRHLETLKFYTDAMPSGWTMVETVPRRKSSPGSAQWRDFGLDESFCSTTSESVSSLTNTPPPREVSFAGSLMALAGQLMELCQGEHGSKLVIKRIEEGSNLERGLVWSELKLPGSLSSFLILDNKFLMGVLVNLAKKDPELKSQLLDQANKVKDKLLIVQFSEFLANL